MLLRELRRLARHSAIYGVGGMLSRVIALFLLPVYTAYLGTDGFGKLELVVALTAVLVIVLQLGIGSAFFRFYFDSKEPEHRLLVIRTCFWFTMAMATLGLVLGCVFADGIAAALEIGDDPWLIRAAFVALWAQLNYQQMTALFRVEERSAQYVVASVANIVITVVATILLVVVWEYGATGAVVGNFAGTLVVWVALLAYRREQLGFQVDRGLLRRMNQFGMPLVPAALFLWAINFVDRFIIQLLKGESEVGVYSLAVRTASVIVFLLVAFRLAWPAFAYSIEDDAVAKRTYAYVLTYLLFICAWISVGLGVLAPWIVEILSPRNTEFHEAADAIGILAFAATAFAGYTVLAIGVGRARRTQFNWVVTGAAAVVNIGLNFALVPPYGMMGAAVATLVSYVALFLGMTYASQRVFPVPYQWRRVVTLGVAGGALTAVGYGLSVPLLVAILLVLAFPLVLLPLGFYQPAELARLRRLALRPS
jgi:O-antigen/teichoic acid export membrane protein